MQTKEELREAKRAAALVETRLRTEIMQTQLARVKKLKESQEYFSVVDGVSEVFDRLRGRDEDFAYPLSNANDRRYGANWPFWRTLIEHSRIRATARLLCTTNSQAIGILGGLSAFIIGSGMVYRVMARKDTDPPKELLASVQHIIDDFGDRNDWSEMEQELFRRSRRDGEYFLRHFFLDDGTTIVYPMEPEWILEPPERDHDINSFGVYNAKGNLYKIEGYWVASDGVTGNGEYVPIGEIDHIKLNVDRIVKRGLSDFSYDCYSAFKRVGRLLENLTEGGAIQAAIAFIRQHESASPAMVDDFLTASTHFVNQNPTNRQSEKVHKYNPGEIVDIDKGQTYLAPPFAANTPGFVQIIQAGLRSVAQRWNAPEWLSSADSSNGNFASSLVAESPFVRKCKEQQEIYRLRFIRTHWKAVKHAAECGRIYALGRRWSWDELKRVIELQATPPTVEVRNKMQEAQTAQIEIQAGMGSRQEYAQAQGKDWERIEQDNEEYEERHGSQGGGLPGGDDNPFGGGDQFGGLVTQGGNAEHNFEMEERTPLPLVSDSVHLTESQRDAAMLEAGFTGRSGKFCYQDGKRVPCPKTGETGKPKAAAKPAKPVLADTHEHIKGLLADPSKLTPQAVGDLATRLQGHTVADLQKLKAELKLKASGPKAELAKKIAERALGKKEEPKSHTDHGTGVVMADGLPDVANETSYEGKKLVSDWWGKELASRGGKPLENMTREEVGKFYADAMRGKDIGKDELQKHNDIAGNSHYLAIKNALDGGKSVSPEVLADYPDLAPKSKAAPAKPDNPQPESPKPAAANPVSAARDKFLAMLDSIPDGGLTGEKIDVQVAEWGKLSTPQVQALYSELGFKGKPTKKAALSQIEQTLSNQYSMYIKTHPGSVDRQPEAPKPAAAKPHEMTKADYHAAIASRAQELIDANKAKYRGSVGMGKATRDATAELGGVHSQAVADAVKAGHKVPPEVLDDYPHLKPPHERTQAEYDAVYDKENAKAGPGGPTSQTPHPMGGTYGSFNRDNDIRRARDAAAKPAAKPAGKKNLPPASAGIVSLIGDRPDVRMEPAKIAEVFHRVADPKTTWDHVADATKAIESLTTAEVGELAQAMGKTNRTKMSVGKWQRELQRMILDRRGAHDRSQLWSNDL